MNNEWEKIDMDDDEYGVINMNFLCISIRGTNTKPNIYDDEEEFDGIIELLYILNEPSKSCFIEVNGKRYLNILDCVKIVGEEKEQPTDYNYILYKISRAFYEYFADKPIDNFDINKLEIHCTKLYLFDDEEPVYGIDKLVYDGEELDTDELQVDYSLDSDLYEYKDGKYIDVKYEDE